MIYTPELLPPNSPLVILLHGGTGSMRSVFQTNAGGTKEWLVLAEKEGFVLLVPNGTNPKTGDTFGDDQNWNDHRSDSATGQTNADDVGFILALLDQITAQYPLDPKRIFVTGVRTAG
jgi:polyhydroxybutyrate depolymerase